LKKVLILALTLVLALGMMGGSFAFFTDVETSTGNVFTASTLDLLVITDGVEGSPFGTHGATMTETAGGNAVNGFVVFNDLSGYQASGNTGDHGFIYWTITNIGGMTGSLDMTYTRALDDDNGINEPEDWADGDFDGSDGTPGGDLGAHLRIRSEADLDNNGSYETLIQNGGGEGEFVAGYPLGVPVEKLSNIVLNPGQTIKVRFEFRFNADIGGTGVDDNIIQTDTLQLDVNFELLQNAD